MRNIKLCISLMAVVLLGCTNVETISPNMEVGSTSDRGYLVGSIATVTSGDEVAPFSVGIFYREKGKNKNGVLSYQLAPLDFHPDVSEHDYEGKLISHEIPPGEYEIYGFSLFQSFGPAGSVTYRPKQEFSVPFTIRKNTATYFGQILVRGIPGKFLYVIPRAFGGRIFVSDESMRDIPLLAEKDFIVRRGTVSSMSTSKRLDKFRSITRKGLPVGASLEKVVYEGDLPFIVQDKYQYVPLVP